MKHIACIFFMSILFIQANAQCSSSCCASSSATATFASLGSDINFQNAHEAPLASNYVAMGRMITFPTPDGKIGHAYFVPAKKQTKNYLFVFQEYWGLNDWIKKQSDLYSDSLSGVNVIALDLYDGKVATTGDSAVKLMQANDPERSKNIIRGAITYAGKDAKIATIGWCFGGGWSMQAALLCGNQLTGCVMYYGMPETDVNKLKTLNSDVLFIWASKDQWINEKVKNQFVTDMNTAGKKLTVKPYDADHAFANPSNPHYDQPATADANRTSMAFLKSHF
jgi:carboxymethylenebutenolidase